MLDSDTIQDLGKLQSVLMVACELKAEPMHSAEARKLADRARQSMNALLLHNSESHARLRETMTVALVSERYVIPESIAPFFRWSTPMLEDTSIPVYSLHS